LLPVVAAVVCNTIAVSHTEHGAALKPSTKQHRHTGTSRQVPLKAVIIIMI
jgi:hypothetical protein